METNPQHIDHARMMSAVDAALAAIEGGVNIESVPIVLRPTYNEFEAQEAVKMLMRLGMIPKKKASRQ